MRKVDCLIVGQGIAGSLLAHELLAAGRSVLVLDEAVEETSSRRAAGIYNPITGRQLVKTWLADSLFPSLEAYYQKLESYYKASFLHPKPIYRPFFTIEEQNDWEGRIGSEEYRPYVKSLLKKSLQLIGVEDPHGGLLLNHCGYVDVPVLLRQVRARLEQENCFWECMYDPAKLEINQEEVRYEGVSASWMINCQGPKATADPLWEFLPFKLVKGEIMDIAADLPGDLIVNRGVFILPKGGLHRVGATYDHQTLDYQPSEKGTSELKERLAKVFTGSYKVKGATAGVRPATFDRKPFIGKHPTYKSVCIFNGFGTKGVSLIPYFAQQMVNFLFQNGTITPDADVVRVAQGGKLK